MLLLRISSLMFRNPVILLENRELKVLEILRQVTVTCLDVRADTSYLA